MVIIIIITNFAAAVAAKETADFTANTNNCNYHPQKGMLSGLNKCWHY
jgi:hypothetical protein